jgi:hypothetical protein
MLGQSFMIGHSFGGLVMKSLVVEAHNCAYLRAKNEIDVCVTKKAMRFLANLKGIAFYAVPKTHLEFKSVFDVLNSSCLTIGETQLTTGRYQIMAYLSDTFDAIMEEFSINICGFIAGKPTTDMVSIDKICKLAPNISQ